MSIFIHIYCGCCYKWSHRIKAPVWLWSFMTECVPCITVHLSSESLWWSTNRGRNDVVMTVNFLFLSLPALLIVFLFISLLLCLLHSIGGSIPIVFSYYSEFLAQEKRGEHLSWLCMFWMIGGIYASAMAWAIIPHYGEWQLCSSHSNAMNSSILIDINVIFLIARSRWRFDGLNTWFYQ